MADLNLTGQNLERADIAPKLLKLKNCLDERKVIWKHVMRNSLLPVITLFGLSLPFLVSGAVLTETVFSWPGLGTYMVTAADETNYPVVMGCMLLFVTTFVIVNLIVDVLYHWIDPRIRTGSER